jgi:hypothetical protein
VPCFSQVRYILKWEGRGATEDILLKDACFNSPDVHAPIISKKKQKKQQHRVKILSKYLQQRET